MFAFLRFLSLAFLSHPRAIFLAGLCGAILSVHQYQNKGVVFQGGKNDVGKHHFDIFLLTIFLLTIFTLTIFSKDDFSNDYFYIDDFYIDEFYIDEFYIDPKRPKSDPKRPNWVALGRFGSLWVASDCFEWLWVALGRFGLLRVSLFKGILQRCNVSFGGGYPNHGGCKPNPLRSPAIGHL